MPFSLQRRRQFRHMRCYSSDRYRMQRFPGEHRNAHIDDDRNLPLAEARSDDVISDYFCSMVGVTSYLAWLTTLASRNSNATFYGIQGTTGLETSRAHRDTNPSRLSSLIDFEIIHHGRDVRSSGQTTIAFILFENGRSRIVPAQFSGELVPNHYIEGIQLPAFLEAPMKYFQIGPTFQYASR